MTLELMNLRASQINGCSVCVDMHSRALKKLGEKDARIFAVAAWREAPYYSDAERAALALTEAASRLSDRADPVPDEVWKEAAKHYDETPARRARDVDRSHQPLEPAQRGDAASRWRLDRSLRLTEGDLGDARGPCSDRAAAPSDGHQLARRREDRGAQVSRVRQVGLGEAEVPPTRPSA